jgi:hypothetical protein
MIICEDIFKCEDIKELRKLALEYYRERIQGKTIFRRRMGYIRFSKKGIKETISHSNEIKLKMVCFILDIARTGKIGKKEEPKHIRNDRIKFFVPITKIVVYFCKKIDVEILLFKDENGLAYYDLFTDNIRTKKVSDGNLEKNPSPPEILLK